MGLPGMGSFHFYCKSGARLFVVSTSTARSNLGYGARLLASLETTRLCRRGCALGIRLRLIEQRNEILFLRVIVWNGLIFQALQRRRVHGVADRS